MRLPGVYRQIKYFSMIDNIFLKKNVACAFERALSCKNNAKNIIVNRI
jgi:hypothetical protein